MQKLLRRHAALTIVVAITVTLVQALLILLVLRNYREAANRRVGEISLTVQTVLIEDELEAKRTWPEIEARLRERFAPIAHDDEMAVYDAGGALVLRSTGTMPEGDMPPVLPAEVRDGLDEDVSVLSTSDPL